MKDKTIKLDVSDCQLPDISTPTMVEAPNRTPMWLSDPDTMHVTSYRREKQSTAVTHKDDTYWEKRLRNNISAKKSRENKRRVDSCMKDDFRALEEENAVLKKELAVLKARFGISESESVLTDGDRIQCLAEMRQCKYSVSKVRKTDYCDSGADMASRSSARNADARCSDNSCSIDSYPTTPATTVYHSPYVGMPYMPTFGNSQHSPEHTTTTNIVKALRHTGNKDVTKVGPGNVYPCIPPTSPYSYTLDSIPLESYTTDTDNQTAADLSIKKEKTWQDTPVPNIGENGANGILPNNNMGHSTRESNDDADSSDDLRMKLHDLSSQVEKMQRLVSASGHI